MASIKSELISCRVDASMFWDASELLRLERVWRDNMRTAALYWRQLRRKGWTRKAAPYLVDAIRWRDGAQCWQKQARELDRLLNSDWQDAAKQYQPV